MAASGRNYRHSTDHQVVIDADTRLAVTVGKPLPGNRDDCRAGEDSGTKAAVGTTPTVIADGGHRGHRPGHPALPPAQERRTAVLEGDHNASHRKVRARLEHTFARMKSGKILRDCRLKGDGVHHAMLGIARLHKPILTG
ncbi:transposase [Streptomyces sp. bgisy095]|uniref:transposase n=1 Tax=unclassified Streptomyces TaxID=2593676 RepID=UPI003D74B2AC